MRKKRIRLFAVILILNNLIFSFLIFYNNIFDSLHNLSNIESENRNYDYPKKYENLELHINEGNFTKIRITSISNLGGALERDPYFISYIGTNISISFYLYDLNNSNTRVLDEENQANITITFNKFGTAQFYPLKSFIKFDNISKSFSGIIETSTIVDPGNYSIRIDMFLLDYDIYPREFGLTLHEKLNLEILNSKPNHLIAGEQLVLLVKVGYISNSTFYPLKGVKVNIKIYLNNKSYIYSYEMVTNQYGQITQFFLIPLKTKDLSIDLVSLEDYNHNSAIVSDLELKITPYSDFTTNFYSNFIFFILSIGVLILIYYILSKKKISREERVLREYILLFEDILKLEYIIILHKKSNFIIIEKSYISKTFNYKMLYEYSNFNFSSNKFLNYQNSLKEFSFNNKILLVTEGKYLIIKILLNNTISDNFKRNLIEFLDYIEILYKREFSGNNIHSYSFEEIENKFENKFYISINSPHCIKLVKSDTLIFTKPYSIKIYNIINEIIKEKKNNFFYLSEIFLQFSKQTNKGIIDFMIGITELKDISIIMPMK